MRLPKPESAASARMLVARQTVHGLRMIGTCAVLERADSPQLRRQDGSRNSMPAVIKYGAPNPFACAIDATS